MDKDKTENEMTEIILKDVSNNTFLFDEKLHFDKADCAIASFFDCQHKYYEKESPKDFIVYLKPESRPPTLIMIKLFVGEFTQGEGEDEETFPYHLEFPTSTDSASFSAMPDKVKTSFRLHISENRMKWQYLGTRKPESDIIAIQPCKPSASINEEMFLPPKRFWVAQSKTSKYLSISTIPEIAALLNAELITENFVVTEHKRDGLSYDKLIKSEKTAWVTVSEFLAKAYKDKPLVTVILKDIENDTIVFSERYYSKDRPRDVACGAIVIYFDQHYKDFAATPEKEFYAFFRSDACPPTIMTVRLTVGERIVKTGIIGSKYDPYEEVYHYMYDDSDCHILESPSEFPTVALELKPPKYDPRATLPIGFK